MSINPENKSAEIKVTFPSKVKYALKKTIEVYLSNPIHYLFYGTLTLMIFGLFIGMSFSWQLYLIMCCLFFSKIYQHFDREKESIIEDKKV